MARAVVLGIGNILLQDEGIGVRVVEALQQHYQIDPAVEVVDGGTKGYELIPFLEVEHVLVVDAVEADAQPGTIVCLRNDAVPRFLGQRLSPHQIGLADLLSIALLRGLDPDETVLIGVQPDALDVGIDLSPTIEAQLPHLVDLVVEQLQQWGYSVTPRTAAGPLPRALAAYAHIEAEVYA